MSDVTNQAQKKKQAYCPPKRDTPRRHGDDVQWQQTRRYDAAPSRGKQTRISDQNRMNLETFIEKLELSAALGFDQDALDPFGQDFASPRLRGSGIVACSRQQHLPRLSTMRTKGGSFVSGPRLLRGRCA
jgi:hypothetical protein